MSETNQISEKEWKALEIKYQHSKQSFSVILEGPAVMFASNKKKRANKTGSRGKYISNCIMHFEKSRGSKSLLQEARDLAFERQLRIYHLERTLRENGVKVPE